MKRCTPGWQVIRIYRDTLTQAEKMRETSDIPEQKKNTIQETPAEAPPVKYPVFVTVQYLYSYEPKRI